MENNLIIKVVNQDGEKIELQLIDTFEVDGKKYSLLAPPNEEEDAYILRVIELGEGKRRYEYIEDDEEFERVLEVYETSFN
jgi:uncharacterized protein YrzB (UPF0473 family)